MSEHDGAASLVRSDALLELDGYLEAAISKVHDAKCASGDKDDILDSLLSAHSALLRARTPEPDVCKQCGAVSHGNYFCEQCRTHHGSNAPAHAGAVATSVQPDVGKGNS